MTQQYISELIKPANGIADVDRIKAALQPFDVTCTDKDFDIYENKNHKVFDKADRPDKIINKEVETETGGTRAEPAKIVKVARLPIGLPKRIVSLAASFLGTPTIKSTPKEDKEKTHLAVISRILDDNKFSYKFRDIVKKTKSEKKSAVIFYRQDAEEGFYDGLSFSSKHKFRMRVVAQSLGDTLYPVFDQYGDMTAFARGYKYKDTDQKEIEVLEVYTADTIVFYEKKDTWQVKESAANQFKKIPVIYFHQSKYEWEEVMELINRLEIAQSDHADVNDYFGSPIFKAKGTIKGFAEKGESGKVLEMEADADAEYLTWDASPESKKLEMDNLMKYIGMISQTPDTSFDAVKGLGSVSGVALKLMFMDAHMKASESEEVFGEGAQRIYNFLKYAVGVLDPSVKTNLTLSPKFTYFLPQNDQETVTMLVSAYEAGILSLETAVSLNPLVENKDEEIERLKSSAAPKKIRFNNVAPGFYVQ